MQILSIELFHLDIIKKAPAFHRVMPLDMVGVASSNLVAPTKFGRKNKHLAETPGAFFSHGIQTEDHV